MMSQRSKRELHAEVQAKYLKASKAEKQKILDEFTANTQHFYTKFQNKLSQTIDTFRA